MDRFTLVILSTLVMPLVLQATEPEVSPVEKQLAIQAAMVSARQALDRHHPAEAIAVLEEKLAYADGHKAFLNLLREAYRAEIRQLEQSPPTNAQRLAHMKRKLALLEGSETVSLPAPSPAPVVPSSPDTAPPVGSVVPASTPLAITSPSPGPSRPGLDEAIAAFNQQNFAQAEKLFAQLGAAKLSTQQKSAWAYCRIKLAADRLNSPSCDAPTAAALADEVAAALELITDNAKLLAVGRDVLQAAQTKAHGAKPASPRPVGSSIHPGSSDVYETASFRVHHGGRPELGEQLAKAAEANRQRIFERWSGPPGGAWEPKCDIVLHTDAAAYARATGQPAVLTGHATVKLVNHRPTERRIDLRADDDALLANTLPRQLTHVILADLFPTSPPPKWAMEGMAILAGSPEEIRRYHQTLPRCARENELRSLAALLELKDIPTEGITGFYCQSVSLTEYLIGRGGERNFKIFLNDAQRYGLLQALKRQYGIDNIAALEQAWKRECLQLATR
ncbi:MAG: hypothetical protein RMJ56_13770 [Gemmataceae bacterium]|nr:hypothetical protein [Gemmata sp.]MDW8198660.1 hypothetical protein [Gemmataceae bacterium]